MFDSLELSFTEFQAEAQIPSLVDFSDVSGVPDSRCQWRHSRVSRFTADLTTACGFSFWGDLSSALSPFSWRQRRYVYATDQGNEASRAALLRGGKGASLALISRLGLPVPAGFTMLTTAAHHYQSQGWLPRVICNQLGRQIHRLERKTGRKFGDAERPLLVSVRSGAPESMPGMMDTVLNVGLNDETVCGLAEAYSPAFALDTYRRFLSMFGSTVMGVDKHLFEDRLDRVKAAVGVVRDRDLPVSALSSLCESYKSIVSIACGRDVPHDPIEQLSMAIFAVLSSWHSERARAYRVSEGIAHTSGTAVNIQAMVFGNADEQSGTGVVFSSDPNSGVPGLYGEYLSNAQGEDVVAGVRTPQPISALAESMPAVYALLVKSVKRLEAVYRDMVDVEFTVESGQLHILQCRSAKRSPLAAATYAVYQERARIWSRKEALERVSLADLDRLTRSVFQPEALAGAVADEERMLFSGQAASPGATVGRLAFSCQAAITMAAAGDSVILVRPDTSPEDLPAMLVSAGLVTATGGSTSHAAVVARGKGIPAVVGCPLNFVVEDGVTYIRTANQSLGEGQEVSLDGGRGLLLKGLVPFVPVVLSGEAQLFLGWVKEARSDAQPLTIKSEHLKGNYNMNALLSDFYVSNLMRVKTTGSALEADAIDLQNKVEAELTSIFITYLAYACMTEARHFGYKARSADILESTYGLGRSSSHLAMSCDELLNRMGRMSHSAQLRFFELCVDVFDNHKWSSSFGGKKWGRIAAAGADYLNGKLSRSVFIDHVFDLRHNGGCLFDKHCMVSRQTREFEIVAQLDLKKKSDNLAELYNRLCSYAPCHDEVSVLYKRGLAVGLWKDNRPVDSQTVSPLVPEMALAAA